MAKPKVLAVVGPTAAGKTSLSIKLAQDFSGEVISADSRQVYLGLDIGTGKVTPEEMQGVPHHLLDVADVDTIYTGTKFLRDADTAIATIVERGNLPIVTGGTYFYVQLLRREMAAAPVPPNPALRTELEQCETHELFTQLQAKDSRRAESIDPHNRRRLIRALEIVDTLGAVPPPNPPASPYGVIMIGIDCTDEVLREKFRTRAQSWLARGLVNEVNGLLAHGVSRGRLHELGFEYQLVLALIDGTLDESAFLERFVQQNWQYAKQQRRWMYKDATITWFQPDETEKVRTHITDELARIA